MASPPNQAGNKTLNTSIGNSPVPDSSSHQYSKKNTPRRQLPQIPDSETQLTLASKVGDGSHVSPRSPGNHGYGAFFTEYSLLAEYNLLQKQRLPGVYVIPAAKSALYWHGVLFIRQGLYQEGVFRFSVHIPESFPECEAPKLIFDPPVFHPVVHPETGELDVKRAFPKWRKSMNHVWQVLLYARRIFYKIDTRSPCNPEAAILYEQDVELFKKKVHDCVQTCKKKLYDPPDSDDAHALRFSKLDDNLLEDVKQKMQPAKVIKEKEDS